MLMSFAIPTLLSVLTFLGVYKYFIEPRYIAAEARKKFATALWISCHELDIHLRERRKTFETNDHAAIVALKKIPNNDFDGKADWFLKEGYLSTLTAYKIAVVSCWLRIYQQELLFSTYRSSRRFISNLYRLADKVKSAFSKNTCLWYDYFDALGDKLVLLCDVIILVLFGHPKVFDAFD